MAKLKILPMILALLLIFSALAEMPESGFLLPETAVILNDQNTGGTRMITACIPETGEELTLISAAGTQLLQTTREADVRPDAAAVERSRAEELVLLAYPGCSILFAEDIPAGKQLAVAGENFCGMIVLADDTIRSRSLQSGEIFRDGKLTMEGALQLLSLYRPGAQFRALELDEDDGVYVYEGEALLDGVEYEFEIAENSGKLLEWERD